jgi:16S rRNA C967 or C1407 C5-methylase (RsmB/RsmF family)/NOL1/NOP2/fmu family ribosome biogenesis protein
MTPIYPGVSGFPARYLERMKELLGDEYPAFEAIYTQPPTHGLRVNTLKLTPAQFEAISPFPLTPLPWSPAGYQVPDETRPGKHPYHAAGLYYLQDPHAQAVGELLAPQPGEAVLDLAASPGGKTTHLASRMQNQGLLVANEIKTKRIGHLAANLERWGARNVAIVNESPERLAEFFGPFFDRVLVDAPCSGEGMFRKDRAAIQGWSEDAILGCAVRQAAILNYAARLVRPGGWLCYSTCTFAPEEDEMAVEQFLRDHPEYELAGLPGPSMLRLWPHHSPGEGHFIALLRRSSAAAARSGQVKPYDPSESAPLALPRAARDLYESWSSASLFTKLDHNLTQVGSRLYSLPAGLPDLSPLRVLHPGWWLGDLKKDRFEPAHALAMALQVADVKQVLTLPANGADILKYLRGSTLYSENDTAGWTLVAVSPTTPDHPSPARLSTGPLSPSPLSPALYPLGWGKVVQGILKNHYPRGLLWI